MEEKLNIGFKYGVMSPTLEEQAKEQGYILKDSLLFQKLREAINLLSFHIVTDSQVTLLFNKLHKKVVKNLKRIK